MKPGAAALSAAVVALAVPTGCKKPAPATTAPSAVASQAVPVDRLAPGELALGTESAFGMPLPRAMRLLGRFPGVVEATGPVSMEDVSNFVRAHVDVARVELGAVGAVFPAVHIKGGDPTRVYRIQLAAAGTETRLTILDVTPRPPAPPEQISNEEAWRRAGYTPRGVPLDPGKLR